MVKKTDKAEIEYKFYNNCPEIHRPKGIYVNKGEIQYERIPGRHPTRQKDWDIIWQVGVKHFWLGLDVSTEKDFETWYDDNDFPKDFIMIWEDDAHPCRILHGCPRAEHIIMKEDIPIFISPHEPEIVCREWDEAYLLMSIVTLWESWTRGWHVELFKQGMKLELIPPFEVTDVHKMFLLAHWEKEIARINYILPKCNFKTKLNVILEELEKDWSPVELREKMINLVTR